MWLRDFFAYKLADEKIELIKEINCEMKLSKTEQLKPGLQKPKGGIHAFSTFSNSVLEQFDKFPVSNGAFTKDARKKLEEFLIVLDNAASTDINCNTTSLTR